MAIPKNASEAIAARLLSGSDITAIVAQRITPNAPTQDAQGGTTRPYVVFYRTGGAGGTNLAEPKRLFGHGYRVECYADTDRDVELLMDAVSDRLFGNKLKGLPVWSERADGVQLCAPLEDRDTAIANDGSFVAGQGFTLWFSPQV